MGDSGLDEELELLEAIYIHELEVKRNERDVVQSIVVQLHPATGDEVDQKYVCMTLHLDIPTQYPAEPPDICIRNPRGVGEEEIQSLLEDMHSLANERKGGPVLYELIELAKESLTVGNMPHCPCMICLEHFHEDDKFKRTPCYHYFHETCLSRFVSHVLTQTPEVVPAHTTQVSTKDKLVCPVCRERIDYSMDDLPSTPVEEKVGFVPSAEMRELQSKMAAMFERQKASGGIIDVEEEKNRFLLSNDDVVILAPPPKPADRPSSRGAEGNSSQEKPSSGKNSSKPEGKEKMARNSPRERTQHYDRDSKGNNFRGNRNDRNRRERQGFDKYDDRDPYDRPVSAAKNRRERPNSSRPNKEKVNRSEPKGGRNGKKENKDNFQKKDSKIQDNATHAETGLSKADQSKTCNSDVSNDKSEKHIDSGKKEETVKNNERAVNRQDNDRAKQSDEKVASVVESDKNTINDKVREDKKGIERSEEIPDRNKGTSDRRGFGRPSSEHDRRHGNRRRQNESNRSEEFKDKRDERSQRAAGKYERKGFGVPPSKDDGTKGKAQGEISDKTGEKTINDSVSKNRNGERKDETDSKNKNDERRKETESENRRNDERRDETGSKNRNDERRRTDNKYRNDERRDRTGFKNTKDERKDYVNSNYRRDERKAETGSKTYRNDERGEQASYKNRNDERRNHGYSSRGRYRGYRRDDRHSDASHGDKPSSDTRKAKEVEKKFEKLKIGDNVQMTQDQTGADMKESSKQNTQKSVKGTESANEIRVGNKNRNDEIVHKKDINRNDANKTAIEQTKAVKTGPPGFVLSAPPGFKQSDGNTVASSKPKPPPGFS